MSKVAAAKTRLPRPLRLIIAAAVGVCLLVLAVAAVLLLAWPRHETVQATWDRAVTSVAGSSLEGAWHIVGSFSDWILESDGTLIEKGFFGTHRGTYESLGGGQVRITLYEISTVYDYSMEGDNLLLKSTVNGVTLKLRPK